MKKLPAIFFGHGSPMNAIEVNKYSEKWKQIGSEMKRPKAILAISAHWFLEGTFVTDNAKQKTIYDFYGFPPELSQVEYTPSGDQNLVKRICELLPQAKTSSTWGLDHGTWSVLTHLYPDADIAVVQLSIDRSLSPLQHYELAKNLRKLRDEGVLIIASGNIVHNLSRINWGNNSAYDWAIKFDDEIKEFLRKKEFAEIINYEKLEYAKLCVPTPEHFLPLLYILGVADENDKMKIFNEGVELGSISMTSVMVGG